MKKYILALTLFLLAGGLSMLVLTRAQNRSDAMDPKTGKELLDSYAKMMENVSGERTGLPSATDIQSASLSNPHAVINVPLDKLKGLDSNGSLGAIGSPGTTTFYEVRGSQGNILALMEVGSKDGKYVAASFGHRAMAEAIGRSTAKNSDTKLFRIPALHLDFLSTNNNGAFTYTALQTVPDFGIQEGNIFSDKDLLRRVLPFAKRYNGLPL